MSDRASAVTYTGTSGNRNIFGNGEHLAVDLTNTSPNDVTVPQDVLMAVFFNTTHLLTAVSASLNGSSVFYGSLTTSVMAGVITAISPALGMARTTDLHPWASGSAAAIATSPVATIRWEAPTTAC